MRTPVTDTGYVLHVRPYRESSAIVELLTQAGGRLSAVAHGVRGRRRNLVIPTFVRCWLSYKGSGELRTLVRIEPDEARWLSGPPLAAGFYANELMVRMLAREDADPPVFTAYVGLLESLEQGMDVAVVLRHFERNLLEALGYGIDHTTTADTAEPVVASGRYRLQGAEGFVFDAEGAFNGSVLLQLAAGDLGHPEARRAARDIARVLIGAHLGGPLRSRLLLRPARVRSS